jgi:hypothetical protein
MTDQERANLALSREYDRREREAAERAQREKEQAVHDVPYTSHRPAALGFVVDDGREWQPPVAAEPTKAKPPPRRPRRRGPSELKQFAEHIGAEFGRLEKELRAEITAARQIADKEIARLKAQVAALEERPYQASVLKKTIRTRRDRDGNLTADVFEPSPAEMIGFDA